MPSQMVKMEHFKITYSQIFIKQSLIRAGSEWWIDVALCKTGIMQKAKMSFLHYFCLTLSDLVYSAMSYVMALHNRFDYMCFAPFHNVHWRNSLGSNCKVYPPLSNVRPEKKIRHNSDKIKDWSQAFDWVKSLHKLGFDQSEIGELSLPIAFKHVAKWYDMLESGWVL